MSRLPNPNSLRQKLIQLSSATGVALPTLYARLRAGVPFEQIANPARRRKPSHHNDLKIIAEQSGISINTLYARLRAGVPITAVTLPRKRGPRDAIARFHHQYWEAQKEESTDRWW